MKTFTAAFALMLTLTSTTGAFAEPSVYIRSDGQFVHQGNEYGRGFWLPAVKNADEVFRGNPEAYREYLDHVDDARWFSILNWGALGLLVTYSAIALPNEHYEGGIAAGLFFVPWIAGLVMGAKSNKHLLRAVNLMNGVPSSQASLTPAPARGDRFKVAAVPLLGFTF